jgi:hypothetical protein
MADSEFGFRMTVTFAGVFDLERRREYPHYQITWYRGHPEVPEWFIRSVVLGPIMALFLHDCGVMSLHGSAVSIDGQAVAFVAPKHHGKSTLSVALASEGALLVTDDLVAIQLGKPPRVHPGVPGMRLLQDSAARFSHRFRTERTLGGKSILQAISTDSVMTETIPMGAIYVLDPTDDVSAPVQRTRLEPGEAVAEIALRTSLRDPLIGADLAAAKLRSVARLTPYVPVYRLRTVRDFEQLPILVEKLMEWHRQGEQVACGSSAGASPKL